jgi:hypothetical protein
MAEAAASDFIVCQMCLAKPAAYQLTERLPSGRVGEAYYCRRCYRAKYFTPRHIERRFPRPTFTLKNAAILLGVWALPNAIAAWVMRSGYITGTPVQLRQWTNDVFLGVNLVLGFFVVWFYSMWWLGRVLWYKGTGGLVPVPAAKPTPRQFLTLLARVVPILALCVVAILLDRWVTPKIWPTQRSSPQLLSLILLAGSLPMLALNVSKNRVLRGIIWQSWRVASWPERVLRAAALFWSLGFVMLIALDGPNLIRLGFKPWFPIPFVFLIGIGGQLVLFASWVLSVRRR